MYIKQSRVINVKKYLIDFQKGSSICVGLKLDDASTCILSDKLKIDRFTLQEGDAIFPGPEHGIMCRRNAVGEHIPMKGEKMIRDTRIQDVYWRDWGGHEHSTTAVIPYSKYPRKIILPKEFSLIYRTQISDCFLIIDQDFENEASFYDEIKFALNLVLELFGEVEIFHRNEEDGKFTCGEIKRVNWEILPPGSRIYALDRQWEKTNSRSKQKYLIERLEFLDQLNPFEKYRGLGGFSNYIAFCFPDRDLYILDSATYGNATYIFSGGWKEVSKLTKKEIIDQGLHLHRILHDLHWKQGIMDVFVKEERKGNGT